MSSASRNRRSGCALGLALAALLLLGPAPVARADDAKSTPPVAAVRFEGNRALRDGQLRKEAVDELKDFRDKGHRRADADDAAFQMELRYRREGYHFAEVDYALAPTDQGTVLTFQIDEGPRVLIRKLRFHGKNAFSSAELRAFFETRRTGLLGKNRALFVASTAASAATSIRDLYYRQGYIDVVVQDPEFQFSADRSEVDIDLTLQEGEQHLISAIRYRGDVLVDAADALEDLAEKLVGQPYYHRRELDVRSAVLEAYGNLGFPDVRVVVQDLEGDRPGAVPLEVEITSGPRATIDEITISGERKTREEFIRARCQLRPGDRYNQLKMRQTFRELYRTGLFTRVNLELSETTEPTRRDLAITVEEGPSRELWFEPGWGSYEKLRLKAGFRINNVGGKGRIARLEGGLSIKNRSALVGLTDPWFLGSDVVADLPVSYNFRIEPSFTRKEIGIRTTFSRKLSPRVTTTIGYGYSANETFNVKVDATVPDAGDNYKLGSLRAQVTFDNRNDVFFPTAGRRHFISGELAARALGGDIGFYRLTAGTRWFRGLTDSTVVGFRYTTGLIIPSTQDLAAPLGERFFNGGDNTVRSFRQSELGPKDSSGDPVGGLGYNVFNLELRQRLWNNWALTAFVDLGNVSPNTTREEKGLPPYQARGQIVSDTLAQFFSGFRPAVGGGLLYLLPVGPARLEYAWNPDAQGSEGEISHLWLFSVGTAF